MERANQEQILSELNWWSAAHLEYALRSLSPRTSSSAPTELLTSLTLLCREEAQRIRVESKAFRERPLQVAAELQPWRASKLPPGASVLLFGPNRHLRPALLQAGLRCVLWRRFASGRCRASAWPELEEVVEKSPPCAAAMRYPDSGESFEFALDAVAAQLPEGAPLWVYGDVREGVLSTTRALRGLFRLEAIHEEKDCRVISARRATGAAKGSFEAWLRKETLDLLGQPQEWWSVPGLFAAGQVDVMTQYLLDTMVSIKTSDEAWQLAEGEACSVLDFASGTGILAAGVMRLLTTGHVCLLDADAAALEAAGRNLPEASQVLSDGFRCDLDRRFNLIISNPPVHHGHADDLDLLLELLRAGPRLLEEGGEMWLVTQEHIPTGRLFEVVNLEQEGQERISKGVHLSSRMFSISVSTVSTSFADLFEGGEHPEVSKIMLIDWTEFAGKLTGGELILLRECEHVPNL